MRERRDGVYRIDFYDKSSLLTTCLPSRSVTLVGEADRKMLKAAVKHGASADQIRHRIVPVEAISKWSEKLDGLKGEIAEIMEEEKEERSVRYSISSESVGALTFLVVPKG